MSLPLAILALIIVCMYVRVPQKKEKYCGTCMMK